MLSAFVCFLWVIDERRFFYEELASAAVTIFPIFLRDFLFQYCMLFMIFWFESRMEIEQRWMGRVNFKQTERGGEGKDSQFGSYFYVQD
jgi:hypothetical protein